MATKRSSSGKKGITLHDVLAHIRGMSHRFDTIDKRFDAIDRRFDGVDRRLDGVDVRLANVEWRLGDLTRHVDALDEDLQAFAMDTISIRRHVGMPVPDDE